MWCSHFMHFINIYKVVKTGKTNLYQNNFLNKFVIPSCLLFLLLIKLEKDKFKVTLRQI